MVALAVCWAPSCASPGPGTAGMSARYEGEISELEIQALVMQMADEYDAVLGETTYLVLRNDDVDPTSRWLTLSFLRNGMGAALDIASGPNPDVALLDLLVLGSLQTWAFEHHWIRDGIDQQAGAAAVARLRAAETRMWDSAQRVLSAEQSQTLRALIDTWIAEHPDRTVVSFVRFDSFTKEREMTTTGSHGRAAGLLREVNEATAAVEDARLFGERALWFASRYPYVLGQQAELTTYRIADQPELRAALSALDSVGRMSETLGARIAQLEDEKRTFFDLVREERMRAIEQVGTAVEAVLVSAIDLAAERVAQARGEAIDQLFARLQEERARILDEFDSTNAELRGTLGEAREAAMAGADAGHALSATADAFGRVLAHFDRDPSGDEEPLRLADLRETAVEARRAAEQLTELFDRVDASASSEPWQHAVRAAGDATDALFWRGAGLVAMLVAGLALVRLVPDRRRREVAS